jgi:antitoxin component of MazEF toxin-antitoxin module
MQIQKVFQAGNSQVVAIPKDMAREMGFKVGRKVIMEKTPDGRGVVIMRADEGTPKLSKVKANAEFQSWLTTVLDEDKDLIIELAKR